MTTPFFEQGYSAKNALQAGSIVTGQLHSRAGEQEMVHYDLTVTTQTAG